MFGAIERVLNDANQFWDSETDESEYVYKAFKERYFYMPDQFVLDCIKFEEDDEPADYQLEVLTQLVAKKRASARGPHGLGKSSLAAWAILWFALTRDGKDWKVATTASAWRQLTKFLWPEVHKWARLIKWDVIGRKPFSETNELLDLSLKLKTGEAFALASHDSNLIEGAHARYIMYVFDESKTIPAATWDSAEGAMSSGEAFWLAISTPGVPDGRFYDIHAKKKGYTDWWARHVKLNEAIKAGRIDEDWAETRKLQWGAKSPQYRNRVLGEFASSESDSVIPLEWIEEANERWTQLEEIGMSSEVEVIGVDVARMGSDKTVYALRSGNTIKTMMATSKEDTMQTAGRAGAYLRQYPNSKAVVDVIGVGAGTVDRLREQYNERIIPFSASERTDTLDRTGIWGFTDKRSAAWWHLREMLDPINGEEVALPPDDDLTGDLVSPTWDVMSNTKIKVESKRDIRKRIDRSTNSADAVVQAFWEGDFGVGMDFA